MAGRLGVKFRDILQSNKVCYAIQCIYSGQGGRIFVALINARILTRVFLTPKSLGSEKVTRVSLYPPSRKNPYSFSSQKFARKIRFTAIKINGAPSHKNVGQFFSVLLFLKLWIHRLLDRSKKLVLV